ncbi:MAG: hypothetical protein L0Z50_11315, partial [Verrucomicrobiales bacterium]|nr:hypothetical protein [Verrucomicrobiales bacterium]
MRFDNGNAAGFWTVRSLDGVSFSSPVRVGSASAAGSRIVATKDTFEAFVPGNDSSGLPNSLLRYSSNTGLTWTSAPTQTLVFGIGPGARNESPGLYSSGCPFPNNP